MQPRKLGAWREKEGQETHSVLRHKFSFQTKLVVEHSQEHTSKPTTIEGLDRVDIIIDGQNSREASSCDALRKR
jgi:hypothetical protein